MAERAGRGRLSGIELLPEECDPIVAWAATELDNRDRTQTEIYAEFFGKLEALQREHRGELNFAIPSFTAFNRYSLRRAALTRRLEQTREIASSIAERYDAKASDDLTLIAAEAIKTLVFEVLTDAGQSGIDPKGALALASALKAASQAQGVSTARRAKVESEFAAKAEAAIAAVAEVKGLSADAAKELRLKLLGVRPA